LSNILDEIFAAKIPSVYYALTLTDMGPSPNQPSVNFATGVMTYEETIGGGGAAGGSIAFSEGPIAFYRHIRRYADHNLTMWHGQGINFKPSTMNHVAWPNELELSKTGSGYYFKYFDKTNPATQSGSGFTALEISTGSGFPGFPQLTTAVIIAKYWLGAAVLVLGVPEGK
jgi:hypothetical protein